MKYKVAATSILVLAFLLKGIITLVLVAEAMAVQVMSATRPATYGPRTEGIAGLRPGSATLPALAALPIMARPQVRPYQAHAPTNALRQCHAFPLPGQQAALPQFNTNLLRSATQGAADISGLDAILVGVTFLTITSTAAFRGRGRRHLHGIVPEVIVPPG